MSTVQAHRKQRMEKVKDGGENSFHSGYGLE
jgi:hypothetical protein